MELRRISCYLLATVALSVSVFPYRVTAQISSDGTLSTTVSTDDAVNFLIENGDISGNNLFHSFSEFSIPNLGSAYFNNATDITNIFSRVTGGNISDIQGLIRANGTANLFLINPAGIVFGENASLDVGGSFFATTAESVVFGDDIEFSAIEPQEAPLLTVNITPGLQMGANPGTIEVQGNGHQVEFDLNTFNFIKENRPVGLQVPEGQTLALVGGDIFLDGGNVTARDGRIEAWAISNTQVTLDNNNSSSLQLSELAESEANWGTITLQQSASMDASGIQGGAIQVRGGGLTLRDASNIFSDTQGSGKGQGISVQTTEFIELLGQSASGQLHVPGIQTLTSGDSDSISGDIRVTTERLLLDGGDAIASFPNGNGSTSGDVIIQATDITVQNFTIDQPFFGSLIGNYILNDPNGNTGGIIIDAERVEFLNGGLLFAELLIGGGRAGDVIIRASESLELRGVRPDGVPTFITSSVFFDGQGQGGDIFIETGKLVLAEGGQILTGVAGDGQAGDIEIRATEILVSDAVRDSSNGTISGINASVGAGATGNSGNITITADLLRVFDGGQITSSNQGEGTAGNINLQVQDLEVQGSSALVAIDQQAAFNGDLNTPLPENGSITPSAISAFSTGNGAAGSVQITASNLTVSDRAQISVSNTGTGDAGNLNINAENIFLDTQGSLQGEVTAGNQGNINLNSQLLLLRNNSNITTNAGNIANGGNITIDTVNLVSLEDSDITANAVFGQGGNITITAQGLFLSLDSDITASSEFGIDGVVEINTPDEENKLAIAELPANLTDASQQIVGNCSWTRDNTFYVVGRRGIAKTPQEHIEIYQMWSDIRDLSEFESTTVIRESSPRQENTIVEANAMIINEDGKVELVAVVPSNNQNLGQVASSCSGEVDS